MNIKKIYRNLLIIVLCINLFAIVLLGYKKIESRIPNKIRIIVNEVEDFNLNIPFNGDIYTKDIGVISVNNNILPESKIHLNFNQPFTLKSNQKGKYLINLKLFGLISLKKIELNVIDTVELIPCGIPIGIYVKSDGLMVLGTGVIPCVDGLNYEPGLNVVKSGDYITKINDKYLLDKKDLIDEIQRTDGRDLKLTLRRSDELIDVSIKPIKTPSGEFKVGIWIRDNTQGIGTLTFIDPVGKFGALGHGITDVDTNLLMDIKGGTIYTADIINVIKGKKGVPGELVGVINKNEKDRIGDININSEQGIFGDLGNYFGDIKNMKTMPIALKQDIKLGGASILCGVDGEVKKYSIEIVKIEINHENLSKGLVISITDERLLKATNGIVQGMSGSPIIQDNKLIGAVTHVFIQDAAKGYGTFIENMIKTYED